MDDKKADLAAPGIGTYEEGGFEWKRMAWKRRGCGVGEGVEEPAGSRLQQQAP